MEKSKKLIYKKIVKILSSSSTCNRAKVGCLILKDERIIATGYNGSINKEPHCDDVGHLIEDSHCIRTIHAEMNAICFCAKNGISLNGCTIVSSHSPCPICTKLIIQAGIKKIYYLAPYRIKENPFLKMIEVEQI